MALYIAMVVVGLVVVALGVLGILGKMLPPTHTSRGSVELNAPQEQVFTLINDIGKFPEWCKDFTKMERLADTVGANGKPQETWRQTMGRNSFVSVNTELDPPRKVTRTITDDNKMFSGKWEHVVEPTSAGACRLTITEVGEVHSAIPRAMMHYMFGEDYTIKKFLAEVKKRVG